MFKTNSRKGIATAAALALGLSGLIATPAQAAVGLNVEPNKGSTYVVPVNDRMDIRVYTDGISTDLINTLKFKIESSGGVRVDYNTATSSPAGNTNATALSATSTSNVVTATKSAGVATVLSLAINGATYTSSSQTVTVTAWLDADGDDTVDDTYTAAAVAVRFLDGDDITWTTEFDTPVLGATSMDAFVSSANVNMQAITKNVFIQFKEGATFSEQVTASYNATAAKFKATASSASFRANTTATGSAAANISISGTVSARTYIAAASYGGTNALTTDGQAIGTNITRVVGATDVTAVEGISISATTVNTGVVDSRVTVSPAATTLKFTARAVSGSSVLKDKKVTFTVTEGAANGLDVGAVLKNGSTELKFTNAGVATDGAFTITTDAKGVATLDLGLTGVKKDNSFTIAAKTEGVAGQRTLTVTFKDAEAASVALMNAVDTANNSPILNIAAKDTALNLEFAVLDTYGALVTGAGYAVRLDSGAATVSNALSAGRTTVTWPGFAATGTYTVNATVLKNGAAVTGATAQAISVRVGTIGTPAAVSQTTTGLGTADVPTGTLTTVAWANADTRLGQSAADELDGGNFNLTGIVTDAAGAVVQGTTVTLAGTDVFFNVGDVLYTSGTATVVTDAAGSYSAKVYANKTGKKTVTITAGSATKTVDLYFVKAATSSGKVITITTTPATVDAGTTVRATVSLTDAFGNPVSADDAGGESVSITYTGPGFVSTIPTKFDSKGQALVSVLLGSKDSGDMVFSASYDRDGDGTTYAAVTGTKTITIGGSAAAPADAKLTVGSFKGYVAIYAKGYAGKKLSAKVAGKWLTVASLSDFQRVVRNTGAGYTIKVDLYIDGSLVKSETITTK